MCGSTSTAPYYDTTIEVGMVFTVEPMLNLGGIEWEMWDDGWTVVTKDRRRSAQFEHTLLVTDDGARWWSRAREAGCREVVPFGPQPWGDKWGMVEDPFGIQWAILELGDSPECQLAP